MRCKLIFTISLFILQITGYTYAAEPVPYKLDDIVVTASRMETQLKETSAHITVISKEEMEEKGVTTLIDALRDEPGVFTSNLLNNPKSSSVDIRGFGETAAQNSLFLIDGRRINDISMTGADLMQVPIEMVERIEVYRGPATVLFGDNAISGVVNIILKKGEGKPAVTTGINMGSYDLFNPYTSVHGKTGAFRYHVLTSTYDTSGYRHNNDLHARDGIGHFSFEIVKNLELNLRAGHHKDTYKLPGYLTKTDFQAGYDRKDTKTPNDFSTTEDNFIDLEPMITLDEDISVFLGGAYRNRHTSFHYETTAGPWDSMRRVETYSLTPKLVVKKNLFSMKNNLVAGIDYYNSPTRSNDVGSYSSSVTRIEKEEYGYYVHDDLHLFEPLRISTGYRITRARYDFDYLDHTGFLAPIKEHLKKEKEAYDMGLNYAFHKDGSVFVNYSKGFRLPMVDEYLSVYSTPPINESLEPHEVREIDLGVRWNFSRKVGGDLTVFYGKHKNEIYYNPITYANENYDKTKREGLEASVFWLMTDNLRLDFGYSYTKARFCGGEYDGNKVPLVPMNKFSGKISYIFDKLNFVLSGTYVGERYMTSDFQNEFRTLPGTIIYDLNILYKYKGFKASAGVKNLLDKDYNGYGSYGVYLYPSAGRQFVLGLKYTF
jgi:iron complex outermembrane receptor protein